MRRLGNGNHDDVDLSTPVLCKDMDRGEFIIAMDTALSNRFPPDTLITSGRLAQHGQYRRAIKLFSEFVTPRETVNLTETTMDEFMEFLLAHGNCGNPEYLAEYKSNVRCLINDLPDGIRRRVLLSPQQVHWTGKLANLTPESQELIREFLRDGRKSKMTHSGEVVLRTQGLTDATKDGSVSSMRTILKIMAIGDLRLLTPARIHEFLAGHGAKGKRDAALRHIGNIRPLCRFLLIKGIITADPIAGISEKPTCCNTDYVRADGISKLGDLRSLDWDDPIDVRDRMISYVLCYDLVLRRSEASWLDVPELKLRDSDHGMVVHLHLLKEKQKGQNKRDCDIFSLFPQSAKLVARYLELRHLLRPKGNFLLVSDIGRRLLSGGVADAVRTQCDKLGIRTKGGKHVSPHRLRHSLATLHASPLGMLDESDLAKRLRHENPQTTRKIYIDNNPEVDWQRHQKLLARMSADEPTDKSGEQDGSVQTVPVQFSSKSRMSELQVIDMLADFGITTMGLRAAAQTDGAISGSSHRPMYSRAYIEDIRDNWTTKGEAKIMMAMTDHQLWHWLNLSGKKARLIGKVSLVRKADVWDELRKRASRKTA